jgi:hypothetical protein
MLLRVALATTGSDVVEDEVAVVVTVVTEVTAATVAIVVTIGGEMLARAKKVVRQENSSLASVAALVSCFGDH